MASQALKMLPKGMKIITGPDGRSYQTPKTRSRKKFKTPAKVRAKMASAARRIKVPVLTLSALGVGTIPAFQLGFSGNWAGAGDLILRNYTGFSVDGSFRFGRMASGLLPLGMVFLINKTGILKPVNKKLASIRGNPLRLN